MKHGEYIMFPLSYIRDILVNKDTGIDKMLDYGIFANAARLQVDEDEAYRQVIYCFYLAFKRSTRIDVEADPDDIRSILPQCIKQKLVEILKDEETPIDKAFIPNEDYWGFYGSDKGAFDVIEECKSLKNTVPTTSDLHANIIAFHRLRQAADFLNLKVKVTDEYLQKFKAFQADKHTRLVSIKIGVLFDFYMAAKSEYEIILLAAFMGVKTILGNKTYARTTKSYILANMFGCKDETELHTILGEPGNKEIKELYKKYSTRKMFDKINKELQRRGWVQEWLALGKAGTFISTKLKGKAFVRIVSNEISKKSTKNNGNKRTVGEYRQNIKRELVEILNCASG